MPKKKDPLAASMRVLKSATCLSLGGRANITYQFGALPEGEVHLRVAGNTGGGFFSDEWVPLKDIQAAIQKSPEGIPISSLCLQRLFRGKSVNTPAFLLAALVHEKWLRVVPGKKRGLEVLDEAGFMANVEKLLAGKGEIKAKPRARKAPKKKAKAAPAKKKKKAVPGTTRPLVSRRKSLK